VGTISKLSDWISRKSNADRRAVSVTAYGFATSEVFVAWQNVSEIWGYKADLANTDGVFLEFIAGGRTIVVSEESAGFAALEAAMIAIFPTTCDWRGAIVVPAFALNRTLLYRRV